MKKYISCISVVLILFLTIPVFCFGVTAETNVVLGINALNETGAEGHSLIWTGLKGESIGNSTESFSWWRSATFEYSDEDKAYIVTSISLTASGTAGKNNYIPQDGFVLIVNLGNDYGNLNYQNKISNQTYYGLDKIKVGSKAYVTGLDFEKNTIDKSTLNHYDKNFTSNAKIYIGEKPKDVEIYTPERSKPHMDKVNIKLGELDVISCEKDFTFTWTPVADATEYILNINDSTINQDGFSLASNVRTKETTYTIPKSKLTVGYTYAISICAVGEGHFNSFNTKKQVFAVSEKAIGSKFVEKKVLAFGDSITALPGWVKMLGGEIGTSVINAGYSGDTTDLALKRIDDDVISKSPDVVIIMFGMNDQALKISTQKPLIDIETYEKNYRTIIKKCQAIKADIILMTGHVVCTDANYYVPGQYDLDYSTGIIDKYYDVIRKLANEFNLDLIDLNAKLKSEKTSEICALGDGIHLSPYGQKKYSEYIGKFMFEDYTEDKNVTSESSEEASSKEASSKETSESNSKTESSVGETSKITSESNGTNTENDKAMTYIVIGIVIAIAISAVVFFVIKKKK